jgi:hypothetical protein
MQVLQASALGEKVYRKLGFLKYYMKSNNKSIKLHQSSNLGIRTEM